jgi:hypothetical protein
MMERGTLLKTLTSGWILTACFAAAGCRTARVGDTVPAPPRALIEKSYQGGQTPAPRQGAPGSRGTAAGPR